MYQVFNKATNQENSLKPDNSTDKSAHQEGNSSSRFSIILLGDLVDPNYEPNNLSSINTFLKSLSIKTGLNNLHHLIQCDDNTSLDLFILKNTSRLLYSSLFSKAHLILILPSSVEDFNCCAKIAKGYAHVLPAQTKIYYLNNFTENSLEHSLITQKATILGYESIHEHGIHCLLELTKKGIVEKDKKRFNDDKTPFCMLF